MICPAHLRAEAWKDAIIWRSIGGDMRDTDDESEIEAIARHVVLAAELRVDEMDLYEDLTPRCGVDDYIIVNPEPDIRAWLAEHPWDDDRGELDDMSDEDILAAVQGAWGRHLINCNGWAEKWFGYPRSSKHPVTLADYITSIEPLEDPEGTVLALIAASRLARRIRDA